MSADKLDIFNISVSEEDLKGESGDKKESVIYKLNAKDGKNNNASSVIKLLPDINNPSKLWVNKWTVWLENPSTEEKRMIDCPSSIKQPSILQDAFFALRKSNNASEQALQKYFRRKEVYYSLCDVIQDPQNQENEGQIKVFRYGQKIFEKIKNLMFPDSDLIEKNIPFDLFSGKPLNLKVKLVSDFNNYDDSIFLDKPYPISLVSFDQNGEPQRQDGKVVRKRLEAKKENYSKIEEYLKEHTPGSLAEYEFKPWDQDTWDFIREAMISIIPNDRMLDKLFAKYNISYDGNESNEIQKPKKSRNIPTSPKIDLDDEEDVFGKPTSSDELDDIDKIIMGSKEPKSKAKSTATTSKKSSIDDELDDIDIDGIDTDDEEDDSDYDDL